MQNGGERVLKLEGVKASKVGKPKSAPRSYALIVREAKEDLTAREVKRRMNEAIVDEVDIRVKKVRPARDGVIVEMASDQDRGILTTCPNFGEAGLRVERARTMDPRVLIFDVPNEITENELLTNVHEKSVKDLISFAEFKQRTRIVRRKEGAKIGNVVVPLLLICRDKVLRNGRVYVSWYSIVSSFFRNRTLTTVECVIYPRVQECLQVSLSRHAWPCLT